MDFKDQLKALARELTEKVKDKKEDIKTEEATKHALIIPFIQILGYDISNPTEVIPEFVSDIGDKKGDKVDYAIIIKGKPFIIIECKNLVEELESHNKQLFHYFTAVDAKLAILTNGIRYQFFSDIEHQNKMDKKPFLDFKTGDGAWECVNFGENKSGLSPKDRGFDLSKERCPQNTQKDTEEIYGRNLRDRPGNFQLF